MENDAHCKLPTACFFSLSLCKSMASPRCISKKTDGRRCTRNATGPDQRCTQHVKWRNADGMATLADHRSPRLYELTQKELNGLAERGVHVLPNNMFTYPDILEAKRLIQGHAPKRLKPSLKKPNPVRTKRSKAFDNTTRAGWRSAANEAHARALWQLQLPDAEFDLAEIEFEKHRQS